MRKAPRQLAQRILSEVDVQLLIREARPGRNRLMFEVAYYGGLRVSEIASLRWAQVIPREMGEVQLALVGKGDKERHEKRPIRTKLHHACATAVMVAVLTVGLAAVGSAVPAAAQETKPNILFIMGDDIGWMQPSIYHEGLAVLIGANVGRR